jgi:hypothetical protein
MTARAVRQRGAALLELQVAAIFAMLPMLFGIVQVSLLCSAYHLLGFAVAEAARAGSVEHAQLSPMYSALAAGLTGLHADVSRLSSRDAAAGTEIAAARVRAEVAVREYGHIERLAPAPADFEDFARPRDGRNALPNDSLEYRSTERGRRSGRSIQQANWLHIRVRYCHELVVPLIGAWLPALLRRWDSEPLHQRCYAAGRVPLSVTGSSPMQSEAWP